VAVAACLSAPARAAEPDSVKYWVLFTDKAEAVDMSAPAESAHATERAMDRRRLRGGPHAASLLKAVSTDYIQYLADLNVRQHVTSNWLNGISAWLTPEKLTRVRTLPFVREVRPVGVAVVEETPLTVDLIDRSPVPPVFRTSSRLAYGPSETQLDVVNAIPPLEQGFNGTGVRLGFLDTTFDNFSHPVFNTLQTEGRLIEVRDFTGLSQTNLHGRSVASIAAGFLDGQIIGPAHGAEIVAATTEFAPTETNQEEDNFVAGMQWLESMGVDVVNVSLGYTTFDDGQHSYTADDLNGDTGITTIAADIAASLGVVVVTSAGNWVSSGCGSPLDCWYYIGTPADGDSVIAVGAVDASGTRASFSSYGPTADGRIKPDVSAMGVTVYHASSTSGLGYGNGTSFSGPMVAGVACQMLQANPALTPMQVLDILKQSASQSQNPDNSLGWGIINAEIAVAAAIAVSTEREHPDTAVRISAYPNPFDDHVTFAFESDDPGHASLRIFDLLGREVARPLDDVVSAGSHSVMWNNDGLAAGIYVYVLTTRDGTRAGQVARL
jgi:hypothetical protein